MRVEKRQTSFKIALIFFILLISALVFYKYIFEGCYFVSKGIFGSDLLRVSIPTYYQLYDSIKEGGFFWNWSMGIGTSMFTHADVYFDPFTYVLFMFGKDKIVAMMLPMLLLKLLAEGTAFYYYMDSFQLNKWACVLSAVMYAFSGYSLIVGSNVAFGTILVYAPLVLLGIEKYLSQNKKKVLFISLFLTCIYSYYFFYIIGIITAAYLFVRTQKKKNPFIFLMKLAGIAGVVIMLGLFSLLPQIEIVLQSARVSGESDISFGSFLFVPDFKVIATAFVRSIGNHLLGNINEQYYGFHYMGGDDYFQVSCYSSFAFIILGWHFFIMEKRRRKDVMLVGGILLAMVAFPVFSYFFNAFSTINARWMFILSIAECALIAFSVSSIIEKRHVNMSAYIQGIILSTVLIVLSMGIIGDGKIDKVYELAACVKHELIVLAILWFCLFFILLLYNSQYFRKYKARVFLLFGVIVVMTADIFSNYYEWFVSDPNGYVYSRNTPLEYSDESAKAIKYILDNDETLFRIYKNFDSVYDLNGIPSYNDAMVQNYFGLKSYSSLNNPSYIKFLNDSGIYVCIESQIEDYKSNGILPSEVTGQSLNYICGVENDFSLFNYLGVKYYVAQAGTANVNDFYNLIYSENGIEIYENKTAYPIAFSNDRTASYSWFMTLPDSGKRQALLEYIIVEDDDNNNTYNLAEEYNLIDSAKKHQNNFGLDSFSPDEIMFQIKVDKDGSCLATSIPFDKNFHIYIDDMEVETEKVNVAMLGAKINKGVHKVIIKFFPKMFYTGSLFSIITLVILIMWHITYKKSVDLKKIVAIAGRKVHKGMQGGFGFGKIGLNRMFIIGLLLGDIAYWIMQALVQGSWMDSYFVNDYRDTGMDHFNMLALLGGNNPYRLSASYPAMCFLLLKVLHCFIPEELAGGNGYYYRELMHAQILYIVCVIALVIAVWELIKNSYKGVLADKILLSLGIIFSGPFLFMLERGNIILFSFVCLLVFIAFYDSEDKKKRWFSYLALAISASIKIYPAVFGLLIIYRKRYKEAVWTAVIGLIMFIAPFFAFDGVYSIQLWLHGMQAAADEANIYGVGYNFSFTNIIKILGSLGGKNIQETGIAGWAVPIVICVIIYVLGKEEWKKIYALSLLCIWLPGYSYTYTLVLLILPMLFCLKQCGKKFNFFSYIYRCLFLLILIPLCLPKMRYLGYGTKFPLSMPTLIINITICLLTVLILTESIVSYIQRRTKSSF